MTRMPDEMKERLRRALAQGQAPRESAPAPRESEPWTPLALTQLLLLALAALAPVAGVAGESGAVFDAAVVAVALGAAFAALCQQVLLGRVALSSSRLPITLAALLLAAWSAAQALALPSYEAAAAFERAALPVLFLSAAYGLGGLAESRRLTSAGAAGLALILAAAALSSKALGAPPLDAASAALTTLIGAAVVLAAARAAWRLWREGALGELRELSLAALLPSLSAVAAAAADSSAAEALAWISAGALSGLCSLYERRSSELALAPKLSARTTLALAPVLAAIALAPAAWLSGDYRLATARRLLALNDRAGALERFDAVGPRSPAWPGAVLAGGEAALEAGDCAGALKRWSALEAAAPDYPGLAYREGLAYAKLGDWPRALQSHEKAYAQDPASIDNLERLTVAAKTLGDYSRARKAALAAAALDPKDPGPLMLLSDIAVREKRARDASRRERHVRRAAPKKNAL